MAVQKGAAARIAGLDAELALANGGSLVLYQSGSAPPDPDVAAIGTLLATVALQNPAYAGATDNGTNASAVINGLPLSDPAPAATGVPDYARLLTSGGATVRQYSSITAAGGGGDILMSPVAVTAAVQLNITAWLAESRQDP